MKTKKEEEPEQPEQVLSPESSPDSVQFHKINSGPRKPQKPEHSRKDTLQRKLGRDLLENGIFAKLAFIDSGEGRESRRTFEMLLGSLVLLYKPKGAAELLQAERIGVALWRKRRPLIFETGTLRGTLDSYSANVQLSFSSKFYLTAITRDPGRFTIEKLLQNSSGVRHAIAVIEEALKEIGSVGYIPEDSLRKTAMFFSMEPRQLDHLVFVQTKSLASREAHACDSIPAPDAEQHKLREAVCSFLTDLLADFKGILKNKEAQEKASIKSEFLRAHLPSLDDIERIRAYNEINDREYIQAVQELQRLQGLREGRIRR